MSTAAGRTAGLPDGLDPAREGFDLFSSPFYLIAHADFKYHEDLDTVVAKSGFDRATYRLMTVLMQQSPLNIGQLSQLALLKRPTVSRALARMRREGLVEMTAKSTDNRVTDVVLTEAGRQAARAVMAYGTRQIERAMQGLDAREIGTLVRIARHIVANLERLPCE